MANQMDELVGAVQRVEQAVKGQMFPVPTPTTPAYKKSDGQTAVSVVLDSSGRVPTTASLSVAAVDGRIQDGADTTIMASVLDYVSSNPLAVRLTDTNGDYVTAGGSTTTVVQANAGTNLNTSALALEAGGNLASIKAKTDNIPVLCQAADTGSVPVVLTAAQVTTLTPPAAITGFALETGGNLASIKAKTDNIPAQGQAAEAASLPVVLPAAQITTLTPPAAITGFALDTNLSKLTNTLSNSTSTTYEAVRAIKLTPGIFFGMTGYNANTADVFIQLHDATTTPADTVAPVVSFKATAGGNFSLDYGMRGRQFANGIIAVTSTSQSVKVLGAANTWIDAQYV